MQPQEVSYDWSCCYTCRHCASVHAGGRASLSAPGHLPRAHSAHPRSAPRAPPRGTFLATLIAVVEWRNRAHGLLLSELGGYLLTPEQAPAGTKRLSNLLRLPHWSASLLADWLWQQADARIQALCAAGETPLLVWDGSVLEKPQTIKNADLCAVRSSKAHRMGRIRPGFFNPPGGRPICVLGLHWLGLLVLGRVGAPVVAAMQWWTSRGERASDQRTQVRRLLTRSVAAWGCRVWHILDGEFASGPWLCLLIEMSIHFVLRFKAQQVARSVG